MGIGTQIYIMHIQLEHNVLGFCGNWLNQWMMAGAVHFFKTLITIRKQRIMLNW